MQHRVKLSATLLILKALKRFMASSIFQEQLNNETYGAAIKNVASVSVLKGLKIILPTSSLMERIECVLGAIDAQIIEQRRGLAVQEALVRSLQHQSFAVN